MSPRDDEPRIWARLDRSKPVPPQREFAHAMRAAPTEAEKKLWWHLRRRVSLHDTHFRRQVRIGRYIVDFATHKAKLIIEIDGGQHASQTDADSERTRFLMEKGYRVLRYWNNEVLSNVDGVLEDILRAITTTPAPDPSPQGGGEKQER